MKTLLSILFCLAFSASSFSQITEVTAYNNTSCTVSVALNMADGACGSNGIDGPISINPGGLHIFSITSPDEYVVAAVSELPVSPTGFNVRMDLSNLGCGWCSWTTYGNIQTGPSNACGTITAEWVISTCGQSISELYIYP